MNALAARETIACKRRPIGARMPYGAAIMWRQARAHLGFAILIGLINCASLLLILAIETKFAGIEGSEDRILDAQEIASPLIVVIFGMVVFLFAGLQCGAEEHELKTLDFMFRLPVSRTRIFIEKLAGAALSIAVYFMLSLMLMRFLTSVLGGDGFYFGRYAQEAAEEILAWSVLFFSSALAAGVVIGRTVPALFAGAATGALLGMFLIQRFNPRHRFEIDGPNHVWPFYAAAGLLLIVAWARFATREGR